MGNAFVTLTLLAVAASACEPAPPMKNGDCYNVCPTFCNEPEEMMCSGGMDPKGCPMPATCMPSKGPLDFNGVECPATCPTVCAPGDMICPAGMSEVGCELPNLCQPEGTDCPSPSFPM